MSSHAEPGHLMSKLDMAFRAEARGGGPDVSEITVYCPEEHCLWGYTYEESVTIGEMIERIAAHQHQYFKR
jgi:hypothetical protein